LGLFLKNRAEGSSEEFFLSGRKLSWWMLGISMVATTFAADTPLAVTGLVRDGGLAGNWVWWNMAIGWALAVFFYARLWRRTGCVTDAELITLRYSGPNAIRLRYFYAVYNGLIINVIVCSWVINAMSNILQVILGMENIYPILFSLLIVAGLYSILSGFWGVVFTDLFQFLFAITGAIVLAYFSAQAAGGLENIARIAQKTDALSFWPDFSKEGMVLTMISFLGIQWWAQRESSMPGYFAQRMFAARNERDAERSALLFNIMHYGLRPWPWILAALATMVLFSNDFLASQLNFLPEAQRQEASYALLIAKILPPGIKGFVVMSLMAAFMSTIDTQANWGASYLIRDLYLPLKEKAGRKPDNQEIIRLSRISMLVIIFFSSVVSLILTSVSDTWKFLFAFTAGLGPVYLLRWYWWQINAEAEILAMVSGAVITIFLTFFDPFQANYTYAGKLIFSVVGSSLFWLGAVLWGPKTNIVTLRNFYQLVHLAKDPSKYQGAWELSSTGWGLLGMDSKRKQYLVSLLRAAILVTAIFVLLYSVREILFYSTTRGFLGLLTEVLLITFLFAKR
jgi:Na+/proline symporter